MQSAKNVGSNKSSLNVINEMESAKPPKAPISKIRSSMGLITAGKKVINNKTGRGSES